MKRTITLLAILFCLHINAQTPTNQPPTVTPSEVCISGTATITIPSSQTGFYYAAVVTNSVIVGNTQNGTGGPLSFPVGTVTATTVYTIYAVNNNNPAQQIPMVPSVTVTVDAAPITGISAQASYSVVCSGSPDILTASGALSYTWSANAGSSTTNSVMVNPTTSAVYTVTGANACPTTKSTTVAVTVNSLPHIIANSPTICTGATTTLTASGANTFTWNTGATTANITDAPLSTTVYTVTGTDVNNCINVVTNTVTVNPLPIILVNPASYSVCPYTATVSYTASGATTYTWSNENNTTINNGNSNVLTEPITGIGAIYYQVRGTDANGCVSSSGYSIANLLVYNNNYNLAFSATQQLFTAPPFIVQFNNTTPSPANYTFTWLFGDGQNQQTNNTSMFHTYSYNGNYDVVLIALDNITGCADTLFKGGYIFCTGGITDINQQGVNNNQINIYPNPNNGSFIIETGSPEQQILKIFDVTGKLFLSQSINNKTSIDASDLNAGVYNISILSITGVINRRMVITK